jgi:DNA polymerase-3 subunit beta
MKFTVSSTDLLKHLQSVQGVIASNSVLPILDNFLFDLNKDTLTISATDLHTSMTNSLSVNGSDVGKIAVPSKILTDTLKALPEQAITFSFDDEQAIEITSTSGVYNLMGENSDDFPRLPTVEQGTKVSIAADALFGAINSTIFAVSTDEIRLAMTGVFFELKENAINFVATDAHRLVKHTQNNIEVPHPGSFIVPRKALNLLKNALSGVNTEIHIEYNKSNAFFSINNLSLICRLIDQKFPDYNAVIPKENDKNIVINRSDFLSAIKRVSIYSNKTTNQIRLKFNTEELIVTAEDVDYSNSGKETLKCEYTGDAEFEIAFNARFVADILSNINTENVHIEFSQSSRPALIFPSVQHEAQELLMLVMPMMISSY